MQILGLQNRPNLNLALPPQLGPVLERVLRVGEDLAEQPFDVVAIQMLATRSAEQEPHAVGM